MSASPVSSDGLKRLQPVVDVAERSASTGTQLYGAAKARLPEPVQARVEQVEQRVGATAAPLLHKAQDTGEKLLKEADARVDAAVTGVSAAYDRNSQYITEQITRQKEFHAQNLETYKQAREAYLKKVEDAVEYVKQRGVSGAAHDAADEVLARVGEAKAAAFNVAGTLVHKVQQAVDRLLSFGPVSSAVEAAQPAFNAAKGQYMRVHDSVLGTVQYKQVFSLANEFAQRAQQTWLYAQAKQRLPQAAVDTATPYFNQLMNHLQPIEAGTPVSRT